MNSSTKAIVILSVILTISLGFVYKLWKDNSFYKSQVVINEGGGKNQAKVTEVKGDIPIAIHDKELAKDIKKTHRKTVAKSEVNLTFKTDDKISTNATITSPTKQEIPPFVLSYGDYHLDILVDSTLTPNLNYNLHQKFKVNIYELEGNDYRAEILEINKDTNQVTNTFAVTDFTVTKQIPPEKLKSLQFGVNLMIGGDVMVVPPTDVRFQPYIQLNFISYGITHLDSSYRFLSLGAGSESVVVTPVSWRVADVLPLFSDLFFDGQVGLNYDGVISYGIGLSSTF